MFQYLLTAGIFVLLAREVCPMTTNTEPEPSTFDVSTSTEGGGVTSQSVTNPGTSSTSGSNQASSGGASSSATTTPASTATASTNNTSVSTASSSTVPTFRCYQGNCTGKDCYKNESLYSTLAKVTCAKNECAMKITQNASWSLTEFNCNDGGCVCYKKVADQEEMCCTKAECNTKMECPHSSNPNLVTSLVVLGIAFVSLYLLN